jgi:hypothetical protein
MGVLSSRSSRKKGSEEDRDPETDPGCREGIQVFGGGVMLKALGLEGI